MEYTYILYGKRLDSFYIGACHDHLETRIENHNFRKYGSKTYTSKAKDWQLYLKFDCEDYPHAIRLERKIKRAKRAPFYKEYTKSPIGLLKNKKP